MSAKTSSLLAAVVAVGCSSFASNADYQAYRAYRYEPEGPARLAAGSQYLRTFPAGRFSAEVRGVVVGNDDEFWFSHRSSPEGLRQYLDSFPQGTHVDEARQRAGVFEAARAQQEAERRAREEAERQAREAQLRDNAQRQRMWARITFSTWMRSLGALQGWGQPIPAIAQANPDFSTAFAADPPGQCRASHCRKNLRVDFSIPIPGRTAVSRAITYTVDIVRTGTERNVTQAMLVVHNRAFTQWWEAENQTLTEPGDAQARETAARWAMDQLRAALVASFPSARETPAELFGPPPEPVMEGVEEDENAPATPVDPNACVIPSQPLGTRWSAVVGCGALGGAQVTAPAEAQEAHARAMSADEPALTAQSCLRFDAWAALDGEGMSADEGVAISLIPPCALAPPAPTTPGRRPRPGQGPRRPAPRPAPANPAP